MLKEQLTELINTLYEAEGLVDMALRRDVATDDRVLYLALAKCHEVSRKAAEINIEKPAESAEPAKADTPLYTAPPEAAESATEVPSSQAHLSPQEDQEVEKEVEVFTNEVLPQIGNAPAVGDISDASIFDNGDDPAPDAAPMSATDATPQAARHDAGNAAADSGAEAGIRPCAAARKPIIRAFSINDKYRYRHSLFEDNDMLMRDTLAEFEAMADFDEALDYCAQTLGWDIESGEAKGFVAVLDKYYKS